MSTYKFDMNSIEEMYSYGLFEAVDSIFKFMTKQIKRENIILLENRSEDKKLYSVEIFHDVDTLHKFYHNFMDKHKISFLTLCDLNK